MELSPGIEDLVTGQELKELNTVDEVAEYLRVSRRTVSNRIKSGEIVVVKVGRAVRIPRASLRSYVEANLKKPGANSN